MLITLTWLVVAVTALALYLRQIYTKFSRNGINHAPAIPFFGNLFWMFLRKEHMVDCFMHPIKMFPEDKVVGFYDLVATNYILSDVETLKRACVKDFEHFVDRRGFTGQEDPMFGRGLLMLTGDEWKAMRSTMSPAFTSSKIRLMVPFMLEVGEEMIKVLKKSISDSENSYIDIEAKDLATRYANDVIATCAFGLKVNSQNVDNQFYLMTKDFTSFPLKRILKIFFYRTVPRLAKMINMTIVPQDTAEFFRNLVLGTMKNRDENKIIRNDLINILMEVKKGQITHLKDAMDSDAGFATVEESSIGRKHHNFEWSDQDLVSQAVLFLFAGFDTVSSEMAFLLHELALNPEVQNKLADEIKEHDAKNGGKFDYNTIQEMTYLDMVVSEILRLWPAAPFMDRRCVKDYNIGRPNNTATKDLIIRKGDVVIIPFWAIHRNPKLYPDPEKFDPERFSPENRHKITPFTYMPFGMGPRNCIGSRFALCEIKVMLYQLIREMEVYPCEKTCIPAKLATDSFNMTLKGGAWVRFKIRS